MAYILKKENIDYDNSSLSIISKNANGSIRDSLSLLEQCIAYCNGKIEASKITSFLGEVDSEKIEIIINSIITNDENLLVNTIENIESQSNYISMMDTIIGIFYKLTLSNINIKLLDENDPHYTFCKKNSNSISPEDLQLYYQIAISSKKDFRQAPSKKDHFIMIILRMIYFTNNNKTSIEPDSKKKDQPVENNNSEFNSIIEKTQQKKTDIDDNRWMSSISEMSLSGLTLHLAMQSVLINIETNSPTLCINDDKKDIYPKLCIEDLLMKIKDYFNIGIDINIEYSKDLLTPIMLESLKSENEVNDRFDKVKDNPDINKLQKVFGANINKESIKKIIE